MKLIWVTAAKHLHGYVVEVTFNDGAVFKIDLRDSLDGPVFIPLKDAMYFEKFDVAETDTLSWPNGADFAPEYLYELGQIQSKARPKA